MHGGDAGAWRGDPDKTFEAVPRRLGAAWMLAKNSPDLHSNLLWP